MSPLLYDVILLGPVISLVQFECTDNGIGCGDRIDDLVNIGAYVSICVLF